MLIAPPMAAQFDQYLQRMCRRGPFEYFLCQEIAGDKILNVVAHRTEGFAEGHMALDGFLSRLFGVDGAVDIEDAERESGG
jgi:uncharacterized protein (DUF2236 family)